MSVSVRRPLRQDPSEIYFAPPPFSFAAPEALTVCRLVGEQYEQRQYRLGDAIASGIFLDLDLRLDDVVT